MIKKYVSYLFKKKAIILILALVILLIPEILGSLAEVISDDYTIYAYVSDFSEEWSALFESCCALSVIYVISLEGYRLKKQNADCYYSLPFKPKSLKRIHFLFGLVSVAAVYTVCFWAMSLIFSVRLINYGLSINFGYIFLSYVASLIYLAAFHSITAFFAHMGNNGTASTLLVLMGHLLLGITLLTPSIILTPLMDTQNQAVNSIANFFLLQSYSPIAYEIIFPEPLAMATLGVDISEYGGYAYFYDIIANVPATCGLIVSVVIVVGLGIGATVCHWFGKDPDGSFSGIAGGNRKITDYIFLIAFIAVNTVAVLISWAILSTIILAVIFIFMEAVLYVISFFYLRTAKLNKWHWICISAGAATYILSALYASIVSNTL